MEGMYVNLIQEKTKKKTKEEKSRTKAVATRKVGPPLIT